MRRSVTRPSSAIPSLCGVLAMRFLSVSPLIDSGENSVGNMASPRRVTCRGPLTHVVLVPCVDLVCLHREQPDRPRRPLPARMRSVRQSPAKMPPTRDPIAQQITFLETRDLARTADFYERVLGLRLARDQGRCRVYHVSGNAYLGFCE